MTGSGASSGSGSSSASSGSGSGNSGSTTTQPEHDPNDCPPDTSKANKTSSSEKQLIQLDQLKAKDNLVIVVNHLVFLMGFQDSLDQILLRNLFKTK